MISEPSVRAEDDRSAVPSRASKNRVLIGGVGYWWQSDASFGLVASRELARASLPRGVEVSDLDYGALYVAQDLKDAQPPYDRLILLAGVSRGGRPGEIRRYLWQSRLADPDEIQARIREAGGGVVDIDHLLMIAQYFGALPDQVIVLELEPVETGPGEDLSAPAAALLPQVLDRVRVEALAPFPGGD